MLSCRYTLHLFLLLNAELIWKVARYTSAAPVYFKPLNHFVDGGVRANNPSNYALTKIQQFLDEQAEASGTVTNEYRILKNKCVCLRKRNCSFFCLFVLTTQKCT